MSKVRLYEIAKELGKESKEIVARAKELGIEVKSHASSVESEIAQLAFLKQQLLKKKRLKSRLNRCLKSNRQL